MVLTYVDDLLILGARNAVNVVKGKLSEAFKMVDLGAANYFLGVELTRDRNRKAISISQAGYIRKVLDTHGITGDVRGVETPIASELQPTPDGYVVDEGVATQYRQIVGELGYLHHSRPDNALAINKLAHHQVNPTPDHLAAAKRVLRYLYHNAVKPLKYEFGSCMDPKGYTDSAFADDLIRRRSTSAYLFTAGKHGTPFSWNTTLQKLVAQSSCEAEYYALAEATKEGIWMQALLLELGYHGKDVVPLQTYEDNLGARALAMNPEFHRRTKHIEIRYHFVRDHINKGDINVEWMATNDMKADGLTKVPFNAFLKQLNMHEASEGAWYRREGVLAAQPMSVRRLEQVVGASLNDRIFV